MAQPAKKILSKVLLLGDINVGKTTLLNKYTENEDRKSTIGVDFKKKDIKVGNNDITLQIWDTAGQEQFASLGFAYFRGANVCVLMFDLSERKSFESLNRWRQQLLENVNPTDPSKFPVVVVGNKQDLQRVVSSNEALAWCKSNGGYQYYETQAINGSFVQQVFFKVGELSTFFGVGTETKLPTTLITAGGAMQLSVEDDIRRTTSKKEKSKEGCC